MLDVMRYALLSFNSIKVRLKRVFSFNKIGLSVFQFHKGTIKTANIKGLRVNWYRFNSIKVRLKQCQAALQRCHLQGFQFHKGTIKTL